MGKHTHELIRFSYEKLDRLIHFRYAQPQGAEYVEANTLVMNFIRLKLIKQYHGGYLSENPVPILDNPQLFHDFIITVAIFIYKNVSTHIDMLIGSAKEKTKEEQLLIRKEILEHLYVFLNFMYQYAVEEGTSSPIPLTNYQKKSLERAVFGAERKETETKKRQKFKKTRSIGGGRF